MLAPCRCLALSVNAARTGIVPRGSTRVLRISGARCLALEHGKAGAQQYGSRRTRNPNWRLLLAVKRKFKIRGSVSFPPWLRSGQRETTPALAAGSQSPASRSQVPAPRGRTGLAA